MKAGKLWMGLFLILTTLYSFDGSADPWSPHEELSFAPPSFLGETAPPQIGVDQKGNVFAVWASQEPLGNVIKASRFDVETQQWSFPKRIGASQSEEPRLAVTHDGKAIVVWKKLAKGKASLFFSVYQENWGIESAVDLSNLSHEDHPSIGVDELGHAIVVWQAQPKPGESENDSLGSVIKAATYQFSISSFGPIAAISTDRSLEGHYFVGQPEVAVNASGKGVAVWRYHDGGATASPFRIQSNAYLSGSWGEETDVCTSPTAQMILPLAAVSPQGEEMAIWLQTGLNYYVVTAATKTNQWGSLTALSSLGYVNHPINPGKGPYLAHAAFDQKGNAFAAWTYIDESSDVPLHMVQAKTYQESVWGKPITLSDSAAVSGPVRVAVDALGNAWAVFASPGFSDGSQESCSIKGSRYIQGIDAWCLPETLSTELNNFLPNISANPKGKFHAVWVADKQNFGIIQSSKWEGVPLLSPSSPSSPQDLKPFPPRHVKGLQVLNEFATRSDRINIITWEAPVEGTAPVSYQFYRDSALKDLIVAIPSQANLKFTDPYRKKGKEYTYYLVTVDGEGRKSPIVKIVIHPLK